MTAIIAKSVPPKFAIIWAAICTTVVYVAPKVVNALW